MRRLVSKAVLGFIAVLGLVATAPAASADSLQWHFRSEYSGSVDLEFFAADRNNVWPGDNKVYVIDDGKVHHYNLSCNKGEKICYGAWAHEDANSYWGSGYGGEESCETCCYTCGAGDTDVLVLNR